MAAMGKIMTLFQKLEDVLSNENADSLPIQSLMNLLNELKATLHSFGMGSVKLNLRLYSKESLDKLWQMYCSGELKRRLETDLPIQGVYIDEEEYKKGCEFFPHVRTALKRKLASEVAELREAAFEHCQTRETIVKLLNDLAEELQTQDTWKKRTMAAAGVIGTAGVLASVLTFGASLYVAAAAVGTSATVAFTYFVGFIIAASTIWLQQQKAKEKTKRDVIKTKRFRFALDAVNLTTKKLGGSGLKRQGTALGFVDAISGIPRGVYPDIDTALKVVSLPHDFDDVISPAIAVNNTGIKEVVQAIHNAAALIQSMEEKEINSYITQIRNEFEIDE